MYSIYFRQLAFALSLASLFAPAPGAQTLPTASVPKAESKPANASAPTIDEKSEAILKRAVEALGGGNYLAVRQVIGRGSYTPYAQGVPGRLYSFIDYLVLPDRERTEFRSMGVRDIQTNVGATGWVVDGMMKTISDMKAEQIENFRVTVRTSVDNLLRGEWRKEGASIAYVGRREAGLAKRNEAVRVTYPDGFSVDFEFGARDGLPAKTSYKRKVKAVKDGVEEEREATEEDRIVRYLAFGGVQVPFTIDHYRDGVQTARVSYDSVEFNPSIPDALFAKPASVKAIK